MIIIDWLRSYRKKRQMAQISPFVDLNPDSFYDRGFTVELRNPKQGKKYISTGSHCVLSGKYVFETDSGKITIGDRVHIGYSTFISKSAIVIEDDVTIAWDCLFYDHNSHSVNWEERKNDTIQEYNDIKASLSPIANKNWDVVKSAPIHICSKAWIGTGVKVLKGVTIGEGAVVAAGSVVVKDVPPWTMVGGNPARVIRKNINVNDSTR